MKKVIILGGSGAGMVAASVAERIPDVKVLGFLNDFVEESIGDYKKLIVYQMSFYVLSILNI